MGALQTVPFYGKELFLVEHEGQPYTPVKPLADNLGIDWKVQHRKVMSRPKRWGVVMMTIPTAGGNQEMACLPVIKLSGFMYSIDPRKVSPEHRPVVELYQEQCDKALFDFWFKGHAVHPQAVKAIAPPRKTVTVDATEYQIKLLRLELAEMKLKHRARPNADFEEEEKIIELVLEGEGPTAIGKELGRPANGITSIIKRLKKEGRL